MRCKVLALSDRKTVERGLRVLPRRLSAYAFAQLAIWKNIYRVEWLRFDGVLCLFFKDRFGSFMNCEPLAKDVTSQTVAGAFTAMDGCNTNKAYSRIENVEGSRIAFYQALGYEAVPKGGEYVYERIRLAQLRGDQYKSKRSACNYFSKTYRCAYVPYTAKHRQACLDLYDSWALQRASTSGDRIYTGMLGDNRSCLEIALRRYLALGLVGRVIAVGGSVRAFTFGYELNPEMFCILYEIADLAFKGIGQYIFRQFCLEMRQYRYINTMDDSGLSRLRAVKQSYRPVTVIPAYIIQRPHA